MKSLALLSLATVVSALSLRAENIGSHHSLAHPLNTTTAHTSVHTSVHTSAHTSTVHTSTASASPPSASVTNTPNNKDPQKSLTLLKSVIATNFLKDGQSTPALGQEPSLTSGNNFINFCATVPNLPITNGLQIKTGSCNPAPMGVIPSAANMPSAKLIFPKSGGKIRANTNFTISIAVRNLETGHFANAGSAYYAAPQEVNKAGEIKGHSHIVIQQISVDDPTPQDPNSFVLFKGLNAPALNGVLSTPVTGGLPAGQYRIATISTAANHQPLLVPVAQRGTLDDAVYFTVTH